MTERQTNRYIPTDSHRGRWTNEEEVKIEDEKIYTHDGIPFFIPLQKLFPSLLSSLPLIPVFP